MAEEDIALLAAPLEFAFSGLTASNRLVKSAMTELICDWGDEESDADYRGQPTRNYQKVYEVWGSQGGMGVLIFGNFAVDRKYPEAKGNPIIDYTAKWDQVAAFKPVFSAAKADGGIIICQLSHAGRQTQNTIAEVPISSSDVKCPPLGPKLFNTPRPATVEEIKDIVYRFAFAAKVCYDAGAHGVQLHGAHGYLISQFLSTDVNLRTDDYGGSLENRSRIIFDIIAAIRKMVPDPSFLLSIKINSADFTADGFTAEDCQLLTVKLEDAGIDLIELSGGTYESFAKSGGFGYDLVKKKESTLKREAYFITFADMIRPHLTKARLCVTGGFRTTQGMAKALKEKSCDLVGLARPLTAEPDLVKLLLTGKQPASKENFVPLPLQTASSNVQIVEMGEGRPLSDLSTEEGAKACVDIILGMANSYRLAES